MAPKKRVLVVDDEVGVLRFVKASLSLEGYDVFTTSSGEEGLKMVESVKPDIILLDILMTPVSGLDVLKRLREHSRLPVIAFTAKHDTGDRAISEGADAFVSKPFMPEQLTKTIEAILNHPNPNSSPQRS